jgi:DNA methylase
MRARDGRFSVTPGIFVNPKVGATCDPVDLWYRYYAGYSAAFVEHALNESAPKPRLVLDPWNGTGTTTVVAASKNVAAIGFDVNPALVVVARARLLGAGVWASIDPLGDDVVAHATRVRRVNDPLQFWFTARAAGSIRGLQQSVHRLLVDSGTASQPAYQTSSGMSTLGAFFYTVLFRTVRVLIASRAGTNPTWWKRVEEGDRLDPSLREIVNQFRASATELAAGLHRDNYDGGVDVRVGLGDSRSIPLEDGTVDCVVGSPPYCTRIDYGIATRPELAVLGAAEDDIKLLRNRMVGTPTITGEHANPEQWGPTATAFLRGVAGHTSKSSSGYYTNYFRQYYAGMWSSLAELRRVMRDGATAVLVVQDNYYKDLHNDTTQILGEMAVALGFESAYRQDFPVVRNRASMNPRARQYRKKTSAVESVLTIR